MLNSPVLDLDFGTFLTVSLAWICIVFPAIVAMVLLRNGTLKTACQYGLAGAFSLLLPIPFLNLLWCGAIVKRALTDELTPVGAE